VLTADKGEDDEGENGEPPNFGLHFPLDYVINTWLAYRNHGILPEPGAFNDQDPLLVQEDWGKLNARYSYLARGMKTLDDVFLPKSGKDWADW